MCFNLRFNVQVNHQDLAHILLDCTEEKAMPSIQRKPSRPAASAAVMEAEASPDEHLLCDCCEPRNPLVLRPDLGVLPDGSPEFALCVLHQPDPTVDRNRGDGG